MSRNESIVEDAGVEWFGEQGDAVGREPHASPREPAAERQSFGEVAKTMRQTRDRLKVSYYESEKFPIFLLTPFPLRFFEMNWDNTTMNAPNIVKISNCETVRDFLDHLSPRGPLFHPGVPGMWLFRGHPKHEEYKLIPSALRESWPAFDTFMEDRNTNRGQIRAEIKVLREFFLMADSIGCSLPEDTQSLRRILAGYEKQLPNSWPPTELLSTMALAQHHGLPTRLLDWSRHPLKAAYFAASGALKEQVFSGCLSVWAMMLAPIKFLPITIVTAPSATNPNLRAQEGVFTFTGSVALDGLPPDRRPLDQVILDWYRAQNFVVENSLHCITLPQEKCIELSLELAREGITRATLFPDLYGVVDAVKEARRFLPQLPNMPE